jgi:hypothetical protein
MAVDYTVIVVYLAGMLAMGWWGMRRAKSKSEFLVAGRRLGPAMYSGTMAAIVLGGASTIGGVGLGYQYGLSGAWMVFTIGLGRPAAGDRPGQRGGHAVAGAAGGRGDPPVRGGVRPPRRGRGRGAGAGPGPGGSEPDVVPAESAGVVAGGGGQAGDSGPAA